jgi:hypothetical protein
VVQRTQIGGVKNFARIFFTLLLALASFPRTARADISPGAETVIGGAVLVAGYGMGSAPAVLGSLQQGGAFAPVTREDARSLIPVAGPMIWWFGANARINARIAKDNASTPCHNEDSAFDCLNLDPFDSGMHIAFALPWMLVSSAAQASGLVLAVHGIGRAALSPNGEKKARAPTSIWLVPGRSSLGVAGTF